MKYQKELQKFASYVRLTWNRRLTESMGGNMSIRINNKVYLTPTTFLKHFFTAEDIIVTDMEGNQLSGKHQSSSEIKMHLSLYQTRKDIGSVFHAHPRYGLLCVINKIKIDTHILPETISMLGNIAYLPYNQPVTGKFAQSFVNDARKGCNVFMLENHGVTTCGDTIETAFARLETLETCAYVAIIQKLMRKNPNVLSPDEINNIINMK